MSLRRVWPIVMTMVLGTVAALAVVVALAGAGGGAAAAPAAPPSSLGTGEDGTAVASPPSAAVAAVGSPVAGMSPITITGPVRTWADVQQLVAGVQAANPGVSQIVITDYVLMSIRDDQWTWFVSWTAASTA